MRLGPGYVAIHLTSPPLSVSHVSVTPACPAAIRGNVLGAYFILRALSHACETLSARQSTWTDWASVRPEAGEGDVFSVILCVLLFVDLEAHACD